MRPQCCRVRHDVEAALEIQTAAILRQVATWQSVYQSLSYKCGQTIGVCPCVFLDCSSVHRQSVSEFTSSQLGSGPFPAAATETITVLHWLQLVPPALYATCDLLHKWHTVFHRFILHRLRLNLLPALSTQWLCDAMTENLTWHGFVKCLVSKFPLNSLALTDSFFLSKFIKSTWLLIFVGVGSGMKTLKGFMLPCNDIFTLKPNQQTKLIPYFWTLNKQTRQ